MDAALVNATVGLVVATALLVVATAIPAIQRWREARAATVAAAARVVPDIMMLQSRLRPFLGSVEGRTSLSVAQLDPLFDEVKRDSRRIGYMVKNSYDVGIRFANEMYILRHLNTCIGDEIRFLTEEVAQRTGETSRHEEEDEGLSHHHSREEMSEERRIGRLAMLSQAALVTLEEAEGLLPRRAREVEGKSFWDRYSQTIDAREAQAEKMLVDRRRRRS